MDPRALHRTRARFKFAPALVAATAVLAVAASASALGGAPGPEGTAGDPVGAVASIASTDAATADDGGGSGTDRVVESDGEGIADAIPGGSPQEADAGSRVFGPVDDAAPGSGLVAPPLLDGGLTASALSRTPAVPTDLRLGSATGPGCATGDARPAVETPTPDLSARVVLLGRGHVAQFELAAAAAPAAPLWASGWLPPSSGDPARYATQVPAELLQEGDGPYAWRIRSGDGAGTSAWSAWCEFGVDLAPAAPAITPETERVEAVYPAGAEPTGAVGAEGRFRLDPGASADVVGYEVAFDSEAPALVDAVDDGSATVAYRPAEAGQHVLRVIALDDAGHRSPEAHHVFTVADAAYQAGAPHVPWDLIITDPYRPVCETGAERPVINSTTPMLGAIGTHPNGGNIEMRFEVAPVGDPGAPVWTSDWLAGQASGQRMQTRPAAGALPAGAVYSWRAEARKGGLISGWSPRCEFEVDVVAPTAPTMTPITEGVETVFYDGVESGTIGKEGRFLLASSSADVVSFRVSLDSVASTTYPAGADGTATFSYTPANWYPVYVTVRAVDRAGNVSAATSYRIEPDDTP